MSMNHKIPRSWFDDDPEWELLRRKAEKQRISKELRQRISTQQPRAQDQPRVRAGKEVSENEVVLSLKLAVPKMQPPDVRRLYATHHRKLYIALASLCSVVLLGATYMVVGDYLQAKKGQKTALTPEQRAKQSFNPLIPIDTKQSGSADYVYDDTKKVLGYTTDYNGVALTVSQQPLPDKVKHDPSELAAIAQSLGTAKSIDTQKGAAYIVTYQETATQVAVFATKEVLVFLKSNQALDDADWEYYINQLTPES